ncbi:MAG: polysaccharide biosynthesis domain-containing protein [Patescibacteria group bacterium]
MLANIRKSALDLTAKIKKQLILKRLEKRRRNRDIQLSAGEIYAVQAAIKAPANFLVFGLGYDSELWHQANPGGRTVFLEDDPEWFEKIKKESPRLEAYLIKYTTRIDDWRELLEQPEKLSISLPPAIAAGCWDLILIDGPAGWQSGQPGRMQSIYLASRLIKPGGDVFVHDCDREVENRYADKYLGRQNIIGETTGRALLRHYRPGQNPTTEIRQRRASPKDENSQ